MGGEGGYVVGAARRGGHSCSGHPEVYLPVIIGCPQAARMRGCSKIELYVISTCVARSLRQTGEDFTTKVLRSNNVGSKAELTG